MQRRVVSGLVVALLIVLSAVAWHAKHVVRSSQLQAHEHSSIPLPPAVQAFEDKSTDMHMAVDQRVLQTAEECDRLHLSDTERKKRIYAVLQAGLAEIKRVRASHYRIKMNPNFPVPNAS